MSNENITINEVFEMFSDSSSMKDDMNEALELVRGHFHKKYIDKISGAIKSCRSNAAKNPSNEIRLLKACKPFINESSHGNIDNMINLMQNMEAFKAIRNNFASAQSRPNAPILISAMSKTKDTSVHEDGVYDIDDKCVAQEGGAGSGMSPFGSLTGFMLMMSLMNSSRE